MNALRQMRNKEQRWADKSAKRHKHNYVEHYIAKIGNSYHDIMKCDKCDSFKAIQHKGSFCGLVFEYDTNLPIITFERTKCNIGFDGIRRVYGKENS